MTGIGGKHKEMDEDLPKLFQILMGACPEQQQQQQQQQLHIFTLF